MEVRTGEGKYEALPGIRVRGRESSKLWVHGMYGYLVWGKLHIYCSVFCWFWFQAFWQEACSVMAFLFQTILAYADLAPGLLVLARGLVFGAAISTLKYNGNYWELSLRVRDIFGLNAHAHMLQKGSTPPSNRESNLGIPGYSKLACSMHI